MARDTTPTNRRAYDRPEIGDDWAQAWDDLVEDLDSASLYVDSTDNTSATDPIPGTTHFEDVDAGSVNTEVLNTDWLFDATDYDNPQNAFTDSLPGQTVVFGPKTYSVTEVVEPKEGQTVVGTRGQTVFDANYGDSAIIVDVASVTIDGITVHQRADTAHNIQVKEGSDLFVLRNVDAISDHGRAISISGTGVDTKGRISNFYANPSNDARGIDLQHDGTVVWGGIVNGGDPPIREFGSDLVVDNGSIRII